jgi:hypothetical protein
VILILHLLQLKKLCMLQLYELSFCNYMLGLVCNAQNRDTYVALSHTLQQLHLLISCRQIRLLIILQSQTLRSVAKYYNTKNSCHLAGCCFRQQNYHWPIKL